MPFGVFKQGSKYCIYKVDGDGNRMGKSRGCHSSKREAHIQIGIIERESKKSMKRDISSEQRKKAKPSDFLYPKERSFPILTAADVMAAVHSFGRSKGKNFDDFKQKLIAMAKRKGFASSLPKEWKEDMKKSVELDGEVTVNIYTSTNTDYDTITYSDGTTQIAKDYAWVGYDFDSEDYDVYELDSDEEEMGPDKNYAVKSLGQNRLGSYATLWGDEKNVDLVEEFFTKDTDEMTKIFESMGRLPWLFEHAGDEALKTSVIAEVDVLEPDDIGLWYEAKIKEHKLYREYVKPLIDEQALYTSSGTLPRARQVKKSGEISRWPIVEITGTVRPAEYRMLEVPIGEVKSHYKSIGLDFLSDDEEEEAEATKGVEKARLMAQIKLSNSRLRMLKFSS